MIKQSLSFQLRRISKLSLPTILTRGILKIIGIVLAIGLLPVALVLHLRGYRHLTVFTDRIGHLAIEPDCVLKEQALGVIQRPIHHVCALLPAQRGRSAGPPERTIFDPVEIASGQNFHRTRQIHRGEREHALLEF